MNGHTTTQQCIHICIQYIDIYVCAWYNIGNDTCGRGVCMCLPVRGASWFRAGAARSENIGGYIYMKKVLLVFLSILMSLGLMACSEGDEAYTNMEIDSMIYQSQAKIDVLIDLVDTLSEDLEERDAIIAGLLARIELLENIEEEQANQTQVNRFFDMLVETSLFGGDIQFVKLGDTVTGTVRSWDYAYIVIELSRDADVEMIFTALETPGEWDMNLYHDNILDPYHTSEDIILATYGTFSFKEGWNIIELDSYSDLDGTYTVQILEVL